MAETASNSLQSGQSLGLLTPANGNRQLWSDDHGTRLALQTDGNLVIYEGKALWSTKTNGQTKIDRLTMQADGNLVLYDSAGKAYWSSKTSGNPGAHCVLQNDSNFVIYKKGAGGNVAGVGALWSSQTGHGKGGIGGVISSVIHTVEGIAPTVAKIAATAAEIVTSNIPGIGTPIADAIGTGVALAEGESISAALLAGVAASLPGNPLSGAAFNFAVSAVSAAASGKPLLPALLKQGAALVPGLSASGQAALTSAVSLAGQVAAGASASVTASADAAIGSLESLAPGLSVAVTHGASYGHAQAIQAAKVPMKVVTLKLPKKVITPPPAPTIGGVRVAAAPAPAAAAAPISKGKLAIGAVVVTGLGVALKFLL